ncbi:putative autophagy-related protein 11 isoform X2 [Mytilus californianus]|uniref:putative autophagy-related protein 11 isoform X2 n=1 Tax=Mytilus californianus TaxID=6549 RepID=UPI0022462FB5|nr:putative autophagy-related protein 11 isoform X2 [Mytilus californianus]
MAMSHKRRSNKIDIESLLLLRQRKEELKKLPIPADQNISFKKYEVTVTKTMTKTKKDIERVSKYASDILEELKNVRELVKFCSVKIGEQLQELMKNYLIKIESSAQDFTEEKTLTRKDIDMKALEQVNILQGLAKQQQELMEFIAKTEDLVIKIEKNADLSLSDIHGVKGQMKQWCDGLETLEEKERKRRKEQEEVERKKMEKEEAERLTKEEEDRKKREQEEAEKRKAQQEEREAEEKRRKQEEEKKKRDWKNWPPFIYYNTTQNKFRQDICCVIFTLPDGTKDGDFVCKSSDGDDDLDKCLETNDEQVISPLITIKAKIDKKTLELPMRVYVPIVSHTESLLPTLKFSIKGQKWRSGKSLPEIQLPKVTGISFIGIELPFNQLENVQCVAVARHK